MNNIKIDPADVNVIKVGQILAKLRLAFENSIRSELEAMVVEVTKDTVFKGIELEAMVVEVTKDTVFKGTEIHTFGITIFDMEATNPFINYMYCVVISYAFQNKMKAYKNIWQDIHDKFAEARIAIFNKANTLYNQQVSELFNTLEH